MTISVNFVSRISAQETFTGPFVSSSDPTVTIDGLSENITLTGTTTPAATKQAANNLPLVSGAATIDLTALPGVTSEETVNGNGLKVQFIKFTNKSTNANIITVTKGASNGYGLSAAGASWTSVLDPGASVTRNLNGLAPTVGSGAKNIDVTGTGTQTLQYHVIFG